MAINFTADEEEAPRSEIDFTPDPAPRFAPAPAPIVTDPELIAQSERKAELFAQQQEARRQGEYWQGVSDRIDNLTGVVVEPLSRGLAGTLGRATDAAVNMATGQPQVGPGQRGLTETAMEAPTIALPKAGEAVTLPGKIAAGAYNATADLLAGLSSPNALAMLPAAANKVVLTAWVSQMVGHQPERAMKATALFKEGKTQEAIQEVAAGIGELGMAEMGRRHVMRDPLRPTKADAMDDSIDPRAAQEAALEATNPRNAQRVVMPESLRELAKEPSEPSVAPKVETPVAEPAAPVAEARPVEAAPAEAAVPLPEKMAGKPVAEIAADLDSLLPEKLEKLAEYNGPYGGGPTGLMHTLGSMAKTPADVAALKEMGLRAKAKIDSLKKEMATIEGDDAKMAKLMEAAAEASKQPWEAYEFATGMTLEGKPKWEGMEKVFKRKGMDYKPTVPSPEYLAARGGAKPEVVRMATAEAKNPFGDPSGTTYRATPEDWVKWQENTAKVDKAIAEAADFDSPEMMEVRRETEAIKNRYGGMAPEPPAAVKESLPAAPEALPNDLPSLARARIAKPELRPQIDAKIAELQAGASPSAVTALKDLPPIPSGHVRLFHGEGGAEGGGTGGAFYTSNIAKASTFGPDVSWVDVPRERAQAAFAKAKASSFSGGDNFILDAADINRSKKLDQKVEQPTHVLDEPTAPRGIAASVRERGQLSGGGEAGAINLAPLQTFVRNATPAVKSAVAAVKQFGDVAKETGKEALGTERVTDYRRSVLNWSAKLQKSFDEVARAQKDIQTRVPDAVRREGITNWIQADGDPALLRQRAAATADPKLKAGYEAALALTPEELAIANQVKTTYAQLAGRGQAADVLNNFKENYVTQIWDLGKSPMAGGSRTLKEKFKFSKASTFPTFFDGEQAGYAPKTKDISKLLPVYMHEMNSVIAAREMVAQMGKGVASDGRPLVARRGAGTPVDGPTGKATLITPKAFKGDTGDYKILQNQPALTGWKWASKDSSGNPIFVKGDLALHPEAYHKLKSVLGKSAIREWYSTPGSRMAEIPKAIARGIDMANSETKRTMLGMLAPFHQVQTGTHAIGHRVSPFGNIPKIDLVGNRRQMDAAKHGLMLLPDKVSEGQFMEGLKTSGLVSKIPGIGPLSDMYATYLFQQYIPGLKMKTYDAILKRNRSVYQKELGNGTVKYEDIKVLSAEQANAAYGHLNYADIARNPTIQHMLQIGLLAPDFLEARGRFFGQSLKGATGAKVGREQLIALAALAIAQAAASYTSAKLSGGEWDAKHPFEFHVGSRKYTMRSVPEDVSALLQNTRGFAHARLSPIVGKGALQYASGVDYAGRKVTAGETTKELLTQPIPITARALPGVRTLSGQDRPGSIDAWEQLAGAVGLKISRYNPRTEINELHSEFLKNSTDPKVKADYEQQQTATFPVSKYKSLDSALSDRDEAAAISAIADLKAQGQKNRDILERMRPFVGQGIESRAKPLFHGSHKVEAQFRKSLNAEERAEYDKAVKERREASQFFLKAWKKRGAEAPAAAPKINFVPDAGQ